MIRAYPQESKFSIIADSNAEFFRVLPKLRQLGVKKSNNQWLVDESVLVSIGAVKMVKAQRSKFCHMPEEIVWVSQIELNYEKVRSFCSLCDSQHNEEISVSPILLK